MVFDKKAPEWKSVGAEPPQELKREGFKAGYKPPAAYFNWFFNRITEAVREIQEKTGRQGKQYVVTVPASGWSNEYPYKQTIEVAGVSADMDLRALCVSIPEDATPEQIKAWTKAYGYVIYSQNGVADGQVTLRAHKKPLVDFTVIMEEV